MTATDNSGLRIAVLGGGAATCLLVAVLATGGQGCDDTKVKSGIGGASAGTGGAAAGTGGSSGGGGEGGAGGAAACATIEPVFVPVAPITADTTWTKCNTYMLGDGIIPVRAPATLTIEPGTTIQGLGGTALVITRGAKIIANGTKDQPILFTSANPAGSRAPGDWGGLLILGAAPTNQRAGAATPSKTGIFEAFGTANPDGEYGGTTPDDSSGSLTYVRLEFGGKAYVTNREWNNLTLCGVGSGTVIDYVQSHKGADDAVEFFGGTVNAKHLVLSQNQDDGLDTDEGWQGKAQFVVIQHVAPMGTDASNGYESDNQATAVAGAFVLEPRTLPTVYNVTAIGSRDYTMGNWGAVLRRGTAGMYYNHIFTKFANGVIEVRDQSTVEQITAGNLFIKNSIFFDNKGADGNWPVRQPDVMGVVVDVEEKPIFTAAAWMNREVDPMLTDAANLTAPNFKPMAGSPALTGGVAPPDDGFYDATATFVGAVGAVDWTAGWTSYSQN